MGYVVYQTLRCRAISHHVAFIMDGNRRWAEQRSLSLTMSVCDHHLAHWAPINARTSAIAPRPHMHACASAKHV